MESVFLYSYWYHTYLNECFDKLTFYGYREGVNYWRGH